MVFYSFQIFGKSYRKGLVLRGCKDFRIRQDTLSKPGLLKGYDSLIDFMILDSMNFNKFFVDFHGDKTYNTFCLWKHRV